MGSSQSQTSFPTGNPFMSQANLPPGYRIPLIKQSSGAQAAAYSPTDEATLLQGEANWPVSKSQEEMLLQQEEVMDVNEDTPQAYQDQPQLGNPSSSRPTTEAEAMLFHLAKMMGYEIPKGSKRHTPHTTADFYQPKAKRHRHSSSSDEDSEEKPDHAETIQFQDRVKLIYSYIGQEQPSP